MRVALLISLICAGLLLVPGTDAYTADQACCATASITMKSKTSTSSTDPNQVPALTIDLGCTEGHNSSDKGFGTTADLQDTPGVAKGPAAKTEMSFDLPPGKYDIVFSTWGCKGATSPDPNEGQEVHRGECSNVDVTFGTSADCTMFLVDQEDMARLKGNYGKINDPAVVTQLLISDSRIDIAELEEKTSVTAVTRDYSGGLQEHMLDFTVFDPGGDDVGVTATWGGAGPNGTRTINDVCNVTGANDNVAGAIDTWIKPPVFGCIKDLYVNDQRNTIHFMVEAKSKYSNRKPTGIHKEPAIYASISVDDTQRDEFFLQELHKPKVCDANSPETLDDAVGVAHGPTIAVYDSKDSTWPGQTPFGKTSNPGDATTNDLTNPSGFDKMFVPVIYDGKKDGNFSNPLPNTDSSWYKEWMYMETYVLDEDLGFEGTTEKIKLKVNVAEIITTDLDPYRVNPGCGHVADYVGTFVSSTVETGRYDGGNSDGDASFLYQDPAKSKRGRLLKIRWKWCPFCSIDTTKAIQRANGDPNDTYQPLLDTTLKLAQLNDVIGTSQCMFEVTAVDNTAVFGTLQGNSDATLTDQDSNQVDRVIRVGAAYSKGRSYFLQDPMPRFTGGVVMNMKPRPVTSSSAPPPIAVAFGFSREDLCSRKGVAWWANETNHGNSSADLVKYCNSAAYDPKAEYRVRFGLVQDDGFGDVYTDRGLMKNIKMTSANVTAAAQTVTAVTCSDDGAYGITQDKYKVGDAEPADYTESTGHLCELKVDISNSRYISLTFQIESLSATIGADGAYKLYIEVFNTADKSIQRRWLEKSWTITPTAASNSYYGGTRRRRTVRVLNPAALAARKRRQLSTGASPSGGLTGQYVSFSTAGAGTAAGMNAAFKVEGLQGKLMAGVPSYPVAIVKARPGSTAELTHQTEDLLADTAALCNKLIEVSMANDPKDSKTPERNEAQLVALVNLYDSLMEKVVYAGAAETSAIEKIMTGLVNLEDKNADTPSDLKELKSAVMKVLEEQKSIESSVLAASKLTNATFTTQQMNNYLIGMLESFESALVTVQYQSVEARNHRLALAAAPAAISNEKWVDSAAGWTQIWMLTMITIMFIYGFCRAIQPQGPEGKQRWFQLPLRENMNF